MLKLPLVAELISMNSDGTGELRADDGTTIRGGATSFRRRRRDSRWMPTVGERYRVLEAKELPYVGWRATEVIELSAPVVQEAPRLPPPFEAQTVADAVAWLRAAGVEVAVGEEASDAEVEALTARLGRRLPRSYEAFLRTFGWLQTRELRTVRPAAMEAEVARLARLADALEPIAPSASTAFLRSSLPVMHCERHRTEGIASSLVLTRDGELRWADYVDPPTPDAPRRLQLVLRLRNPCALRSTPTHRELEDLVVEEIGRLHDLY